MCPEDNLLVAVQIIRNELFPDNRNHGLDGLVTQNEMIILIVIIIFIFVSAV